MKEKIRLQIAKFYDAFSIQIVYQDENYTKEMQKKFPHGYCCRDGWTVLIRNYPSIGIESKHIFLRGAVNGLKYKLIIYQGTDPNVLDQVLNAIHDWAAAIKGIKNSKPEEHFIEMSF